MSQVFDVAPGVRLVQSETEAGEKVWSYVTDWGTIRDARALVGSIVNRQFHPRRVAVDREILKAEGFTGLYLGMVEYRGQRPLGSYASYYIFNAVRNFLEGWGEMRLGDIFATMRLSGRVFVLAFKAKECPVSRLPADPELAEKVACLSMDLFPAPTAPQADTSAFWARLSEVALRTGGLAARNLDILLASATGVPLSVVAGWYGIKHATAGSAAANMRRRLARDWDAAEAWRLLHQSDQEEEI